MTELQRGIEQKSVVERLRIEFPDTAIRVIPTPGVREIWYGVTTNGINFADFETELDQSFSANIRTEKLIRSITAWMDDINRFIEIYAGVNN